MAKGKADTLAGVASADKMNLDTSSMGGRSWNGLAKSIAGAELPNWMIVLGAIIVVLVIYAFIH